MTDTDARIDAALRAEERRLLEQIGEEPAFFSQAFGLFRTRNAWVNWIMMITQTARNAYANALKSLLPTPLETAMSQGDVLKLN